MVVEDLKKLSGRIAYILRVYSLSDRALGEIASVSGQTIGDVLKEKQKSLKIEYLKKISEKLDISLTWLSTGSGEAPMPKNIGTVFKPKDTLSEEIRLRQKIEELHQKLLDTDEGIINDNKKTMEKLEKLYERMLVLERENAELKSKIK